MDFDPRDYDSRDEDRFNTGGDAATVHDLDHDEDDRWAHDLDARDRDDDDARQLGRGPGEVHESHTGNASHDPREDARWPDRDRDPRDRGFDPRERFIHDLNLPRGRERELVRDHDREYTLRASETRTLATVGAFRVVSSRDLRDAHDRPLDPRSSDLRHLREQRLVETRRLPGSREHAVALTREGRSLLEHHRGRTLGDRQTFWHGLKRERELEHDLQVYRAYERAAERLSARDAQIERVILDHELKREYQTWLHERDRDRSDYDGHPDRTVDEIREWAREHDLPYFDDEVHFPDLRIEYRDPDGREDHEDIEVVTEHYRGAHGASVAQSGFSCYRGSSLRIGGGGGRRGGAGHHGGLAEEMWE
jgi:hypothetical protein